MPFLPGSAAQRPMLSAVVDQRVTLGPKAGLQMFLLRLCCADSHTREEV